MGFIERRLLRAEARVIGAFVRLAQANITHPTGSELVHSSLEAYPPKSVLTRIPRAFSDGFGLRRLVNKGTVSREGTSSGLPTYRLDKNTLNRFYKLSRELDLF